MRLVHISEYGKRHGFIRNFIAGEGYSSELHFPSNPSMKHAFTKMLWLIRNNNLKTRKEILNYYNNNDIVKHICSYGNSFTPYVDHYWSDLHRNGYICHYRDGKRILYSLTEKGWRVFDRIPGLEKRIFL